MKYGAKLKPLNYSQWVGHQRLGTFSLSPDGPFGLGRDDVTLLSNQLLSAFRQWQRSLWKLEPL